MILVKSDERMLYFGGHHRFMILSCTTGNINIADTRMRRVDVTLASLPVSSKHSDHKNHNNQNSSENLECEYEKNACGNCVYSGMICMFLTLFKFGMMIVVVLNKKLKFFL